MNFTLLSLFLLGFLAFHTHAAPEPRPFKVLFMKGDHDGEYGTQRIPVTAVDNDDHLFAEDRQSGGRDYIDDYNNDDDTMSNGSGEAKANDMNARLFNRGGGFMNMKNGLFGNKKQQIVIQIFPNGTSSVSTLPTTTTNVVLPTTNIPSPTGVFKISNNDDDYTDVGTAQVVASTIGAQRKGATKDQDIIVRIPAEYNHLFHNGQQVYLSANNGVNKRRMVNQKRVSNKRKEVNKKNMKNQNQRRTHIIMV